MRYISELLYQVRKQEARISTGYSLRRQVSSARALRPLLAPFDAGARPPVARHVFLAAGRHDAVATRRGHLPLVRGWGARPRCYPRGHLTLLFACAAVRADLASFLAAPGR